MCWLVAMEPRPPSELDRLAVLSRRELQRAFHDSCAGGSAERAAVCMSVSADVSISLSASSNGGSHSTIDDGLTPFHDACARGDIGVVKAVIGGVHARALALKLTPNARRGTGQAAKREGSNGVGLHIGGSKAHEEAGNKPGKKLSEDLRQLIELQALPFAPHRLAPNISIAALLDLRDREGWTPLHHAAFNGCADVAQLLLALGADAEASDVYGLPPVFYAGSKTTAIGTAGPRDAKGPSTIGGNEDRGGAEGGSDARATAIFAALLTKPPRGLGLTFLQAIEAAIESNDSKATSAGAVAEGTSSSTGTSTGGGERVCVYPFLMSELALQRRVEAIHAVVAHLQKEKLVKGSPLDGAACELDDAEVRPLSSSWRQPSHLPVGFTSSRAPTVAAAGRYGRSQVTADGHAANISGFNLLSSSAAAGLLVGERRLSASQGVGTRGGVSRLFHIASLAKAAAAAAAEVMAADAEEESEDVRMLLATKIGPMKPQHVQHVQQPSHTGPTRVVKTVARSGASASPASPPSSAAAAAHAAAGGSAPSLFSALLPRLRQGWTPLHLAAATGDVSAIAAIARGSIINAPGSSCGDVTRCSGSLHQPQGPAMTPPGAAGAAAAGVSPGVIDAGASGKSGSPGGLSALSATDSLCRITNGLPTLSMSDTAAAAAVAAIEKETQGRGIGTVPRTNVRRSIALAVTNGMQEYHSKHRVRGPISAAPAVRRPSAAIHRPAAGAADAGDAVVDDEAGGAAMYFAQDALPAAPLTSSSMQASAADEHHQQHQFESSSSADGDGIEVFSAPSMRGFSSLGDEDEHEADREAMREQYREYLERSGQTDVTRSGAAAGREVPAHDATATNTDRATPAAAAGSNSSDTSPECLVSARSRGCSSSTSSDYFTAATTSPVHAPLAAQVVQQQPLYPACDISVAGPGCVTPLHFAACLKCPSAASALLALSSTGATIAASSAVTSAGGADPTQCDDAGLTPIHWAARAGATATLQALLQAVRLRSSRKHSAASSPLHGDVGSSSSSSSSSSSGSGAAAMPTSSAFSSAHSSRSSDSSPPDVCGGGLRGLASTAVADEAAVWAAAAASDQWQNTPLHYAALHGCTDAAALLLTSFSAPADVRGRGGATPLHMAAFGGHAAVIETLLTSGAHPGVTDVTGRLPLHYACAAGHLEAALLLIGAIALGSTGTGSAADRSNSAAGWRSPWALLVTVRLQSGAASAKAAKPSFGPGSREGAPIAASAQEAVRLNATGSSVGTTPLQEAVASGNEDAALILLSQLGACIAAGGKIAATSAGNSASFHSGSDIRALPPSVASSASSGSAYAPVVQSAGGGVTVLSLEDFSSAAYSARPVGSSASGGNSNGGKLVQYTRYVRPSVPTPIAQAGAAGAGRSSHHHSEAHSSGTSAAAASGIYVTTIAPPAFIPALSPSHFGGGSSVPSSHQQQLSILPDHPAQLLSHNHSITLPDHPAAHPFRITDRLATQLKALCGVTSSSSTSSSALKGGASATTTGASYSGATGGWGLEEEAAAAGAPKVLHLLKLSSVDLSRKDRGSSSTSSDSGAASDVTLAHIAAVHGRASVLRYLRQVGVSLGEADSHGDTPLHYAAFKGHAACVAVLLKAASGNWQRASTGGSSSAAGLRWAADISGGGATSGGSCGVSIDSRNADGGTPLHAVCNSGSLLAAQNLLAAGCDPVAKSGDKSSALHLAAYEGHAALLCLLLVSGADKAIDDVNIERRGAIHEASANGYAECCAILGKAAPLVAVEQRPSTRQLQQPQHQMMASAQRSITAPVATGSDSGGSNRSHAAGTGTTASGHTIAGTGSGTSMHSACDVSSPLSGSNSSNSIVARVLNTFGLTSPTNSSSSSNSNHAVTSSGGGSSAQRLSVRTSSSTAAAAAISVGSRPLSASPSDRPSAQHATSSHKPMQHQLSPTKVTSVSTAPAPAPEIPTFTAAVLSQQHDEHAVEDHYQYDSDEEEEQHNNDASSSNGSSSSGSGDSANDLPHVTSTTGSGGASSSVADPFPGWKFSLSWTACANVNLGDSGSDTPCHWAACHNNAPALRALVACGAELSTINVDGGAAIHAAAINGSIECLQVRVCAVDVCCLVE